MVVIMLRREKMRREGHIDPDNGKIVIMRAIDCKYYSGEKPYLLLHGVNPVGGLAEVELKLNLSPSYN